MISKAYSWEAAYSEEALLLSVLVIAISCLILLTSKLKKEKVSLPPGPWGLPIVGNLPFLDPDLHSCFAKLSLKYGPIMKVQLGSQIGIVFSSPEAAKEVLQEQDTTFAHRDVPSTVFISTYGATDVAFAAYGEHWRMMRKLCVSELLSPKRLEGLYGLRQKAVQDMVKEVRSKVGISSIDISELVLVAKFNMMTSMMWGDTFDEEERRHSSNTFRKLAHKMARLGGEANISDLFPVLAGFDIQGKQRKMKEIHLEFDQIFESIIDKRRKMASEGKENKDFLQVLLQRIDQEDDEKTPFTITHLKALFLDMIIAGTTATSVAVEWAMTELLNNPSIMKRLQEELERIVGLSNAIEETHLPELPYLEAVVKEVLRLHPTGPLLVPRCPMASSTVGGYLIPAGSKIFVNVWAIQRDPKYWENPLEFRPERFLMNSSNNWDYNGRDFRYFPFGAGRRICVGISVAEKALSTILASLVHSFNWELPRGIKLDLGEEFGIELKKKVKLEAIPLLR
ncbi:hypothetical protein ACHQM5_001235 [Ranunculus cassubicifolius]